MLAKLLRLFRPKVCSGCGHPITDPIRCQACDQEGGPCAAEEAADD